LPGGGEAIRVVCAWIDTVMSNVKSAPADVDRMDSL
jgi:hypothetical protein